jgi:hypothetical protein
MSTFTKDPDATLDYRVDWSAWMGDDDEIVTVEWLVPEALTVESDTNTETTATVWVSGGLAGTRLRVTCRITTTVGRIDDRTITLVIRDK